MVTCPAPESMKWETVYPVEIARVELEKVANNIGGKTRDGRSIIDLRRSEYIGACSNMIYSWLLGHGSTLPLFTEAKRLPILVSKNFSEASRDQFLWTGNRCMNFMHQQIAKLGRMVFFKQLWSYTDHYRLRCAVPPLIAWPLMQPTHKSLTNGIHGGEDLVRCARLNGNLRLKLNRK